MTPDSGATTGRISISCAFEENAIRAISRAAHRREMLAVRAMRDPRQVTRVAAVVNELLRHRGPVNTYVSKQTARVLRNALPEDVPASSTSEFVRVIGGRYRTPLTHRWGNATWKVLHDRAARKVDYADAETLISMPGSSLETFRSNRHRRLVLHEIDAHPRTRNEMLRRYYGERRAKAEMYPEYFVERIEHEIALADRVLVPGRVVGDQMRSHGVTESRIVTVPYGVDPTIFRPGEADRRGTARGRLRAVVTGQVCLRKGIPFLLDAVRNQPIDLTIVGQVFDTRIMRNLPPNVTVAGILTPHQLADLYATMDVFVLPSIEDCFALVVAEAAAAGLPVVTTWENGAHQLLSDRHTVVDAGDIVALRDALAARSPLTWDERQAIAEEAMHGGWTDWDAYGERVIAEVTK